MRYTSNPKKAETIVNAIINEAPAATKPQAIQNIFTWIKEAEDANRAGFANFMATVGNYRGFVQGGYHYLYQAKRVGFNNIDEYEYATRVGSRRADFKVGEIIYECKNTADYSFSAMKDQFKDYIYYLISTGKEPAKL